MDNTEKHCRSPGSISEKKLKRKATNTQRKLFHLHVMFGIF